MIGQDQCCPRPDLSTPATGLPATRLDPGSTSTPPTGLPSTHLDPGSASTAPIGLPTGHLTPPPIETAPSDLPTRPGPSSGPTSQTLTYGYDRLYRLTSASGGPAGSTSYTYDPVGNRATRVRSSVTTTYAYDRADRISSAGSVSYTVDANGNQTARGSDSLAYDQANRLTGINYSSPSTPTSATPTMAMVSAPARP